MLPQASITLPSGAQLSYSEYGDPKGHPLIFAHGGPGSRIEGEIFHDAALAHGFRFLTIDRPGLGGSTFQPEWTLLDYPRFATQLADSLGIETFGVMGWSGGGAPTVQCAYTIPERLSFAIVLAGYTNWGEYDNPTRELLWQDRIAASLSKRSTWLLRAMFWMMKWSVKLAPGAFIKAFLDDVPPADRDVIDDPVFRERLIRDQREALTQGARGIARDAWLQYQPWAFSLADISFPLHVMHGDLDKHVPLAFGQHLAEKTTHGHLHILKDQGHMFPVTQQDQILSLASRLLRESSSRPG